MYVSYDWKIQNILVLVNNYCEDKDEFSLLIIISNYIQSTS